MGSTTPSVICKERYDDIIQQCAEEIKDWADEDVDNHPEDVVHEDVEAEMWDLEPVDLVTIVFEYSDVHESDVNEYAHHATADDATVQEVLKMAAFEAMRHDLLAAVASLE